MEIIVKYLPYLAFLVPILTGILELLKKQSKFLAKIVNLLGLLLGVGLFFLCNSALALGLNISLIVFFGIVLGLASTGFYELVKPNKGKKTV